MSQLLYNTPAGITVTRTGSKVPYRRGLGKLLKQLDTERGAYLSSGYEYPERYSRWDVATVTPPIQIVGRNRTLTLEALNERGQLLVKILSALLGGHPHVKSRTQTHFSVAFELHALADKFPEEERSKQPSYFSLLRAMVHEFKTPQDSRLVLIGAFGYDLLLEFDPIQLRLPRADAKDLHLFLCDDIYFMDRKKEIIEHYAYDFAFGDLNTAGLGRTSPGIDPAKPAEGHPEIVSDHAPEEYMAKV